MKKTINVSEATWKALNRIKLAKILSFKTIDDVINELLSKYEEYNL